MLTLDALIPAGMAGQPVRLDGAVSPCGPDASREAAAVQPLFLTASQPSLHTQVWEPGSITSTALMHQRSFTADPRVGPLPLGPSGDELCRRTGLPDHVSCRFRAVLFFGS
jgi:hypothetical protein